MSKPNCSELSLKVVKYKETSDVLFAEANGDMVDVFLSFLTLPLGNIVRILDKHYGDEAPFSGSLTNLLSSLVNLDTSHFSNTVQGSKQMFLNPINSFQVESFVIKSATFVISGELCIEPAVSCFLKTLRSLDVHNTMDSEITTMSIDADDIMDLLKFLLISMMPLKKFVLKKTQKSLIGITRVPWLVYGSFYSGDSTSRPMVLKIYLQQSTNKFLLAEATDEFVEFLFSFLALPLGGVGSLIGNSLCFGNIDNICQSVRDLNEKYFVSADAESRLKNLNILPLTQPFSSNGCIKVEGSCVKEPTMYIVRDDLTVTPFSMASCVSILNSLGVSLYEVKEQDFQIGSKEALDILRDSLSSTSVFTRALIDPMLRRQLEPVKRHKTKR